MSATRSAGHEPASPPGPAPPRRAGGNCKSRPDLAPPPAAHAPPPSLLRPQRVPRHFRRVGGAAPGVARAVCVIGVRAAPRAFLGGSSKMAPEVVAG